MWPGTVKPTVTQTHRTDVFLTKNDYKRCRMATKRHVYYKEMHNNHKVTHSYYKEKQNNL